MATAKENAPVPHFEDIDCRCCRLPARVRDEQGEELPKICDDCAPHQGRENELDKARDHEIVYWELKERADSDAAKAHERADAALASRDKAVRALGVVREHHWLSVSGCTCGEEHCPTGAAVSGEWLTTLLSAVERRAHR